MDGLLRIAFQTVFTRGNLRVTGAGGTVFNAGDGSGKPVALKFTSYLAQLGVLFDPELRLGEAYMDRHLIIEEGDIADFLAIAQRQEQSGSVPLWLKIPSAVRYLSRRLRQYNPRSRSRANVAHHYDIDPLSLIHI